MTHKTRKHYKKTSTLRRTINAKNGTKQMCKFKSCKAKKYRSIYGADSGGSARVTRQLFY